MKYRARLSLLFCALAGVMADTALHAASPPEIGPSVAAFVIAEATAGDLNGDGDTLDAVVHVLDPTTGAAMNLGLAVPLVCDFAFQPVLCSPVPPVVTGTLAAFLVSEKAQGEMDLNGDDDTFDDVVFVYDAAHARVRSTELAVARAARRSVGLLPFPMAPIVIGDVVVFLAGEGEQGHVDLNDDADQIDAVVFVIAPKSRRIINTGLAAPRVGFFTSPVLVASGDGTFISVLVGEYEQDQDLNRDGDEDDLVTMLVRAQNGKARLAE